MFTLPFINFFRKQQDPYDCVGYETLLEYIERKNVIGLKGDFVEIGTLFGGGARKLSEFLKKNDKRKKLFVIDIFDINADDTKTYSGISMNLIYRKSLEKLHANSQLEVFKKVTSGCANIRILKEDSASVSIPTKYISFAFVDGNHSAKYVDNDFHLIWKKLVSHGVISFHDYKGSIPDVTQTLDALMKKYERQILSYEFVPSQNILFIQKK